MQEAIPYPTEPAEATDGLRAAARRAEAWAGEPFLRPNEDPAEVLAEGRAGRKALDDALAEMEAGQRKPSRRWKVRYGLMLGLERVLSGTPPRLASGTELRRHQVDALAGMLIELIAANQEQAYPKGIDAVLEEAVDVATHDALGDAYAAQADWDPRGSRGYVWLVLRPVRVQAWRDENEIADRTLMRDGTWLV